MEVITDLNPKQLLDFVTMADDEVEFTLTATAKEFTSMLEEYYEESSPNKPTDIDLLAALLLDKMIKLTGRVVEINSVPLPVKVKLENEGLILDLAVSEEARISFENQVKIDDELTAYCHIQNVEGAYRIVLDKFSVETEEI